MYAMNFLSCPNCRKIEKENDEAEQKKIDDLYGKIPVEEWLKMRDEYMNRTPVAAKTSLREEFDLFGADAGTFSLNYRCECTVCGMKFSHTCNEPIPLPGVVRTLPDDQLSPSDTTMPFG